MFDSVRHRIAVAALSAVMWSAVAQGITVSAQRVATPIAGDATDLEVFPKPKRESYTGMAINVGKVSFDLGAWESTPAGHRVHLVLDADERAGTPATVSFHRADAEKAKTWLPDPGQGYQLEVDEHRGTVTVRVHALGDAGFFWAVRTLEQLLHPSARVLYIREAQIEDWPSVQWRGVKATSRELLQFYSAYKLNFGWKYIGMWPPVNEEANVKLAKLEARLAEIDATGEGAGEIEDLLLDDGAVGNEAQLELTKRLRAQLAAVKGALKASSAQARERHAADVQAYLDHHAAVAVSFNPGGTLQTSDAYVESVRRTYAFWHSLGVRHFVTSFDDQGRKLTDAAAQRFPTYGAAQAYVLRTLAAAIDEWEGTNRYYLCHQNYHGNAGEATAVRELVDAGLPEGLRLCWTGTGVTTRRLGLDDVESYSRAFGRPASLFYQNWPITAPSTRAETGPLLPHDPAIGSAIEAHMMCSNHDRASYVAFLSGLDWAWNSEGYDPQRSTQVAAREWVRHFGTPAAYAPLRAVMEWTRTHSSQMIVPDQAQRPAAELAGLVDAEQAFFAYQVPKLRERLHDPDQRAGFEGKALVDEIEAAAARRGELFRSIVKMRAALRKGTGVRRGAAIALDGKLDEADWRGAPALSDFKQMTSPALAEPNTVFKVLYDDAYVYVGARCLEPKLDEVNPYTARTGWKIQHGDFIQLVFDVTGDKSQRGFACTTILGQASMYDFGSRWMQGFQVAIGREDDAWTAEFRLPLAKVAPEHRPAPGRLWGINCIRRRVVKSEGSRWSSWNPCADKFNPAYCGDLVFE